MKVMATQSVPMKMPSQEVGNVERGGDGDENEDSGCIGGSGEVRVTVEVNSGVGCGVEDSSECSGGGIGEWEVVLWSGEV